MGHHEVGNHDMEELGETERNLRSPFRHLSSSFSSTTSDLAVSSLRENNDDEMELQWAAIQRLPTFKRVRTSLFDFQLLNDTTKEEEDIKIEGKRKVIDVTKLGALERSVFIEKLITEIEYDNLRLLEKLKERIGRQESIRLSLSLFCFEAVLSYHLPFMPCS
ncbi:hypothetical protein Golob_027766 [Gossypium lobatum]|uniref:Uncharacterized protein n=1 Tax=Gossypium lobatum TaxID=34289 RepID=A0A7J8NLP1_9ROSI|nr:hypothetical protein [Gossypium lobatum]